MKSNLYEVWGDTVDAGHLAWSILIGAAVSLGAFFIARQVLGHWVQAPEMARAYAMLVGILGCLCGGAISAVLFKPKRTVIEHQADPAWRAQALAELREEFGDIGTLADLPEAVIDELKEMDLYALFAEQEHPVRAAAPAPGAADEGGRA